MNKYLILLTMVALFGHAASGDETQCMNVVRLTDVNHAIEPGYVVPATDTTPAYCHVRGVINRAIRFEVTMPLENWNGRLMFSTVGGLAGTIGDVTSLLPRGFAMASTDTGHELAEGNNFLKQPEALLDYAYRGVHLSTLAAKRLITSFYGRDISYSYLSGCSNGGRAALMEVVRFPDDYDGVIAGAPVYAMSEFIPWTVSVARAVAKHPLTHESLQILADNSRQACDALDGVVDGVINDPRHCSLEKLNLVSLKCEEGQSSICLSAGQIETATTIYSGLKDADGNVVSPGVAPGAENAGDWSFWTFPSEQMGGVSAVGSLQQFLAFLMRRHPGFDVDQYDPANGNTDFAREIAPFDAHHPDLSEFKTNGGKLIIFQGWNDFPLRPQRAIDHLASVEETMGDDVNDFYRLFMVPGMTHCAGGPGAWQADYVEPLLTWREKGSAPEIIVGKQSGVIPPFQHLSPGPGYKPDGSFSRPQCVYPKLAHYRGEGDDTDAANYECR